MLSAVSVHNLVIFGLNLIVGAILMWLILRLRGKSVIRICSDNVYCLNEDSFYLILCGMWNGMYYFYKTYISERNLMFPVIYQRKILHIKSELLPLFKKCLGFAIMPTICFIFLYSMCGEIMITKVIQFFEIERENSSTGMMMYLQLWLNGALFYYKMNLNKTFFNVFLTEPITFPLYRSTNSISCLQESINMSNLPIIQKLACFDLYHLAHWSKNRRHIFFTLSQPGGHPYNWNYLVENVLKLLTEYIEILNKVTGSCESTKKTSPQLDKIQNNAQTLNKFHNIRNMSSMSDPIGTDLVELTREPLPIFTLPILYMDKFKQRIQEFISCIKIMFGVNFLLEPLHQADIQRFLANGYVIIWSSQGIAELACASLTEDCYGIVQKDLPAIITTLVNLKQNLDKLNKLPILNRKLVVHEGFSSNMKAAISVAVKRSLFNIYKTFGNYINELPLNIDVLNQL